MELDVSIGKESIAVPIDDPFRVDLDAVLGRIGSFLGAKGVDMAGLDIGGLLPKMIKGIAGCEAGCPADAKGFVSRGFSRFQLEYIEGGILSARASVGNGTILEIRMFPEF